MSGAREEAVALGVNLIAGGSKRVAEGLCQVCVAACNSSAYRSFCLLRALPINSMPSPAVVGALHAQPCIVFLLMVSRHVAWCSRFANRT